MIYVGSLKYSPVYKSHCCAFGEAAKRKGYRVKYLFSREYEWMLTNQMKRETIFVGSSATIISMLMDALNPRIMKMIRDAILEDRPTHVYIHNYHLLNHYIAKICKICGSKFIYHVHEPYVEDKSAHGGLQQYWLYLNEHLESRLLKRTDIAVVSSSEASRLFDMRYSDFQGRKVEIPLLYEDMGGPNTGVGERKYITFIGPPVPAKGPGILLDIIDYSNKHDLGWSFLLVSRLKIEDHRFDDKDNLRIFCKQRISDEEFGSLIRKSLLVLTPYRRETQSSVILVSYMHGTPVVSSNVGGLPEFVREGKTGCLVDSNAGVKEWVRAIEYVRENLPRLSSACRKYFDDNFSGKNWSKYLDILT